MYTWETGCKTSTSTIYKTMKEKNKYNKRIYTNREKVRKKERERERERERACGQNIKLFLLTGQIIQLIFGDNCL